MVPIYPASTAGQAAYVAEHCDAKVLFVDGTAQLQRIFEEWPRYAGVARIVTLGIAGNGALPAQKASLTAATTSR